MEILFLILAFALGIILGKYLERRKLKRDVGPALNALKVLTKDIPKGHTITGISYEKIE